MSISLFAFLDAADMHMQTVTRAAETTKPRRAQDHIERLEHIEFQYGGSKIQDLRLHGTPGRNLGFREGHIEIFRPY